MGYMGQKIICTSTGRERKSNDQGAGGQGEKKSKAVQPNTLRLGMLRCKWESKRTEQKNNTVGITEQNRTEQVRTEQKNNSKGMKRKGRGKKLKENRN